MAAPSIRAVRGANRLTQELAIHVFVAERQPSHRVGRRQEELEGNLLRLAPDMPQQRIYNISDALRKARAALEKTGTAPKSADGYA